MNDVSQAIEAVWKSECTRLIASIARVTRDVGIAEELAQDALVTALERWPVDGIPSRPGAWLMTAAKRRAIDHVRRGRMVLEKHAGMSCELEEQQKQIGRALEQSMDQVIEDDALRLIFTACHPLLAIEGRLALTLRTLCGLTTAEIARAFLVQEKTIGQRIFRAKKALADARVPFEIPCGDELHARLPSVLLVVYLIFNEGYTATSGDEWMRCSLSNEALRLGRMVAQFLPAESEVHALVALMELNASRIPARLSVNRDAILLPHQDRALWDRGQVERGMAALRRAELLGGQKRRFALQAAIAACHMCAQTAADTDWDRIVHLYDALLGINVSPVVLLNRAVAVGMARGPAAGLDALDAAVMLGSAKDAHTSALLRHHLFYSVRGDFLGKLGHFTEAAQAFRQAIALTANLREQELLAKKLSQLQQFIASDRTL